MKRVVMINSNKGGVGKTFTARLLGDVVRNVWKLPIALYDADGSNGGLYRVHGLRGQDGKLVPNQDASVGCGYFNVRNSEADSGKQFFGCVAGGHASVLIDMPGGSSGVIQKIADDGVGVDILLDVFNAEGYRVTLLHLLTNNRECYNSVELYQRMFGDAADHVAVLNKMCCARVSAETRFENWNNGTIRSGFLAAGGFELYLPAIHETIDDRAANFRAPMSSMLTSSEVQIFERAHIKRLLKVAAEAFEPVKSLIIGG